MISANIQQATVSRFLREVKALILRRAQQIICQSLIICNHTTLAYIWGSSAGDAELSYRQKDDRTRLKAAAQKIVECGEWIPALWMIDKSITELNAILDGRLGPNNFAACSLITDTVFPDVIVRICQFHIIQAIMRWVLDPDAEATGPTRSENKKRKKWSKAGRMLPRDAMPALLNFFRRLQRCRDTELDPWRPALQVFEDAVRQLCEDYDIPEKAQSVLEYFRNNWWTPVWRGTFRFSDSAYTT